MLLSSHLLHQIQAVCDRVGLFHRGRMVLEGAVPDLARQVLGGAYNIHLEAEGPDLTDDFRRLAGVVRVARPDGHGCRVEAQCDLRGEVSRAVVGSGGWLLSLQLEQPSLDEVYVRYFTEVAHAA